MGLDIVRAKIIAEVGINHNGSLNMAKELAEEAREVGADIVKFQTFWCFPDLRQHEFTEMEWGELFVFCNSIDIQWASTPFDRRAIDFLRSSGMNIWKIPSGMVTNSRYLKSVCDVLLLGDRIIMSTGMCERIEVIGAIQEISAMTSMRQKLRVTVMQCTTAYPAKPEEINLKAMTEDYSRYGRRLILDYGLSDHSTSIYIPIAAMAMGASVIEKHLTLDRNLQGPDHKASLLPCEFAEMVKGVREIEKAMGNSFKIPTESELINRDKIRERMRGLDKPNVPEPPSPSGKTIKYLIQGI